MEVSLSVSESLTSSSANNSITSLSVDDDAYFRFFAMGSELIKIVGIIIKVTQRVNKSKTRSTRTLTTTENASRNFRYTCERSLGIIISGAGSSRYGFSGIDLVPLSHFFGRSSVLF